MLAQILPGLVAGLRFPKTIRWNETNVAFPRPLRWLAALLGSDVVPFAYAGLHNDFLKDHAVLVACPKLDDFEAHQLKLTEILRQSRVKSLTVLHMEVPCCSGLVHMAKQAMVLSGKDISLEDATIGIQGELKNQS